MFFSAVVPSILPLEHLTLGDFALLILASSLTFIVVFGAWAVLAAKARPSSAKPQTGVASTAARRC